MKLEQAKNIADQIVLLLKPHCDRIEIAGSIRRKKTEVKDIEIVAIPKSYQVGLFESGIATIINKWDKVKGELPCKYTQRILPEGIKLDLFFATPENWGLIYAIRTGSADYSHKVLATAWVKAGYKSIEGNLFHVSNNKQYDVREEIDLFKRIGVKYIEPEFRSL
jgi:DNA polymerase/3'-5' exonuclease PolX